MIYSMEVFYIDSEQFDTKGMSKREIEIEFGRLVVDYSAEKYYGLQNREIIVENKKPRFKSAPLHFSISHSRNIILAAFSNHPVGVDVEYLKQRDFGAILKYLRAENVSTDMESFYTFWTAYEAKIKLQGEPGGLATTKLMPEFILSIACSQPIDMETDLKIYELKNTGNGIKISQTAKPLYI